MKRPEWETRSPEQIRDHYEIEKEFAARLRSAGKAERKVLYSELYDELFRRVPLHPLHTFKNDPEIRRLRIQYSLHPLQPLLKPDMVFLEVGPGDCSLAHEVANMVDQVIAVDVSAEIVKGDHPENFQLILSDGSRIPVPSGSVDVVFSNQLMEHLHPEDALDQLREIRRVLVPGGVYLCITPNRLFGPHEVARYYDRVATGFHLKEYSVRELSRMFRSVGFSKVRMVQLGNRIAPALFDLGIALLEGIVGVLPPGAGGESYQGDSFIREDRRFVRMGLKGAYLDYILECVEGGKAGLEGKTMIELGDQIIVADDIRERTGKEFFTNLGVHHTSVDLNGEHGAIPIDLSKPANRKEWVGYFDIVTNSGTTEHVEPYKAQYECFKNIHDWTKPGGLSIHLVPDIDELRERGHWKGHCNNYYSRAFFEMLAGQNDHELVSFRIIDGLACACLKKRSDRPFMIDRQKLLEPITRESGGIVYDGINDSLPRRILGRFKRLLKFGK